jgi:hypothetical protein
MITEESYPIAQLEWDLDQNIWTAKIMQEDEVLEDLGWYTELGKAIAAVNKWRDEHGV